MREEAQDEIYAQGIFHPSIDVNIVEEIHLDIHTHEVVKEGGGIFNNQVVK